MLGAFTIAFSSILVRLSHASPSTAAIFRCAYALPVLGVLAWREDRRLGPRPWRERRTPSRRGYSRRRADPVAPLDRRHRRRARDGAGEHPGRAGAAGGVGGAVRAPGRRVLAALPIALMGVLLISGVLEHGAYGTNPGPGGAVGGGRASPTLASCCCCDAAGPTCGGPPGRCSTPPPPRPRSDACWRGWAISDAEPCPRVAERRLAGHARAHLPGSRLAVDHDLPAPPAGGASPRCC